jgi:predicted nucleic acid-binding protein
VSKAFFDTNILIYQLDKRYPRRQETCRQLMRKAALENEAVISTQVLQEFYVATTKKMRIDPLLIKSIMRTFGDMEIVTITSELIEDAIDANLQYKISFWDSLIIVAAESAKCQVLYSEDLQDGQTIHGVRVINPLK